jgi:outer membrane protein assembly factor BamD (BamD/ComL family)
MNIYFYKGIVEMQQQNYNDAIVNFTEVVNYRTGSLQRDATWLRGLAYIKNNNFEAAREDLNRIAQIKGWIKAKEARKILKSMR